MTASLKARLIAGFILAFLAGGATGAFFTFHQARDWRRHFGHHSHGLTEHLGDRLKAQLDLTPEQMVKVQPILDQAGKKLQQIRSETGTRVRQVMADTNQALQPILTDAQRARLQKIEQQVPSHDRPRKGLHRRRTRGNEGSEDGQGE